MSRRTSAARVAAGLSAALAALSPTRARSQPVDGNVARADALFQAAKQLRDAGQYADACPSFAESQRLAPGVGIALYLADCYEHLGRTSSAWKEFRDAEKLARERNDPRAEVARARAQAIEPRLSGLTIVVPGGAAREAPEVLLDDVRIPPDEYNVAMAVDPGDHVVTVKQRGQPPRTYAAHVDAGVRGLAVRIEEGQPAGATGATAAPPHPAPTSRSPADAAPGGESSAPAAPPPAAPSPPSQSPAPAEPSDTGAGRRWAGLALLGAGIAGVGLGTVFLLKYESTANPPPSCTPPPKDTDSQIASGVSFGLGGVAIISSLVVLLSAPRHVESGLLVAPVPMSGGGGAMLRGSF